VLSEWRAASLAARAERDGSRRWRPRRADRAWRILEQAGDSGDRTAIDAVWQSWCRVRDDRRWQLLIRWRGLPALARDVLAAATDPARTAQDRAALASFCARHGLAVAPAGETERVLFYALTGQFDQCRAVDPDASMLAVGYQAAGEPARAALRQALADSGDMDLVRVIAARPRDQDQGRAAAPAADAERAYLIGELARRRDWDRLWRLVPDFPLTDAVAAVQRLTADWRPGAEAGRRLLALLAAADPARIQEAATPAITRLTMVRGLEWIAYPRVAADGSAIVMSCRSRTPFGRSRLWYELPSGRRLPGPRAAELDRSLGVVPVRDGFMVAESHRLLHRTGTAGERPRDVTPAGLRLADGAGAIICVASEPHQGLISLVVQRAPGVPDDLFVLGPDYEPVGHVSVPVADGLLTVWIAFCGPGLLITRHGDTRDYLGRLDIYQARRLRSWRVGPDIAAEGETELPPGNSPSVWVRPLPVAGLIEIYSFQSHRYLDARSFQPAQVPVCLSRAFRGGMDGRYSGMELTPDGSHAVKWTATVFDPEDPHYLLLSEIEVHDLQRQHVSELLRRPLADFRPADLEALAGTAIPACRSAVDVGGLSLLRDCLEWRFGAEIQIAGASSPGPLATDGDDDIALSPAPPPVTDGDGQC